MKDRKWLGQEIREARLRNEMTQLELANKLGYQSMQFVSLFERGLSKVPMKVLGRLIVILGLPKKKIIKKLVEEHEAEITKQIESGGA